MIVRRRKVLKMEINIEPQVMGKNLNLSPIVILLAVPITSVLKIIFESIPALKPLAAAMSGE